MDELIFNDPILKLQDLYVGKLCYRYQLRDITDKIIVMSILRGDLLTSYGEVLGIFNDAEEIPRDLQGLHTCVYNYSVDTPDIIVDRAYEPDVKGEYFYAEKGTIIRDKYVIGLQTYFSKHSLLIDVDAVIDEMQPLSVVTLGNNKSGVSESLADELHNQALDAGFDIMYGYGFTVPTSYMKLSLVPIKNEELVLSYARKDYTVIGQDILSKLDYHFGKSRKNGRDIFLACRKEHITEGYLNALQEHFGLGFGSPVHSTSHRRFMELLRT